MPVAAERAARAIGALRSGGQVIVWPDSDLLPRFVVTPADSVEAETISRLSAVGQGQIFLALTDDQCGRLGLEASAQPMPASYNQVDAIDARAGIGAGLSAADRAHTIRLASSPAAGAADFVRPGHVLPLRAAPNGLLERRGPTEAATDLVVGADRGAGAVISPLLAEDPEWLATMPEVRLTEILEHRWRHERLVEVDAAASLPTPAGGFRVVGFREKVSGGVHLAFIKGDLAERRDLLLSVHRECVLGTHLHGRLCRCAARLEEAIRRTQEQGGLLIYSQIRPADRADNPLASCAEVRARVDAKAAPPLPDDSAGPVVAQILRELRVESVRWLGGALGGADIPAASVESYGL
jgi:3,4-dihydroxy 2-butanone 4-phosphate synthase/GTP cyclohydrolase II